MADWQTSFTAGEISKEAAGRWDLPFYPTGAEALENWYVLVEGGITRTPGGIYIDSVKVQGEKTSLLGFSKSNDDSIVVLAGAGYLRFYDAVTGSRIDSGGSPVEVATPYAAEDLLLLYNWQSADVMWVTCKTGLHQPQLLIRFTDDTWQFNLYGHKNGPFQNRNNEGPTLNPSGTSGSVTVTASTSQFEAGDVGNLLRFWEPYDRQPYETWKPENDDDRYVNGDIVIYDGQVYEMVTSSGVGEPNSNSPPVHTEGVASDGSDNVSWRYLHNLSGIVRITAFSSATSVSGTVETTLPTGDATPTWARGYFCERHGWPFAGGIFQSRLFYIGTPDFPDTLWMTRTDGFSLTDGDFLQSLGSDEVNDDFAVVRTLSDGQVHRLAWTVPGEQIIVGHAGGIVRISGPSIDEPITPAGASARRPEPPPGAYFDCNGIRADQSIVYASTSGRELIALNPIDFTFETLTARARDKGAKRFRRIEYAKEPYSRLFVHREDGRLYAIAYDKEQGVQAFSSPIPGGNLNGDIPEIDDILVLPGPDGRDQLWYTVRRTINGNTEVFLERQAVDFEGFNTLPEEAIFADAAVLLKRYNEDPAKTMTITASGGAEAALRDTEVTVTTAGHVIDAQWIGREYRVRRRHAPARPSDVDADVGFIVDAIDGNTVTATLVTDVPSGLYNVALDQWALSTRTIDGLDHLEGETVGVWGDGVDIGDYVVSSGQVVVDTEIVTACIGLRKPFRARGLDVVLQDRSGASSKGKTLKVKTAWVDILDAGLEAAKLHVVTDGIVSEGEALAPREHEDLMTAVPGLQEGLQRLKETGRSSRHLQLEIAGNTMAPMTVRAVGGEIS